MAIVHHIPGRLRLKLPSIKRNEQQAGRLHACLATLEGVRGLKLNHLTGSIVIHYEPDANIPEAALNRLRAEGFLDDAMQAQSGRAVPGGKAPRNAVRRRDGKMAKVGGHMGKKVVNILVEKALERSAVALIGAIF